MSLELPQAAVRIAAAIGDNTRASILACLMDGRARTSTELAVAADVSPSTASEHLVRLRQERLIKLHCQGRHRYYSLESAEIAALLEQLSVLAGRGAEFTPATPARLRLARTCYDHLAGSLAVRLHDRLFARGWLIEERGEYTLTPDGARDLHRLGIDVFAAREATRRFAYPCVDWSERRPHVAGAVGAALLKSFLRDGWIVQDLDSRAVSVTRKGQRQFAGLFGVAVGSLTAV